MYFICEKESDLKKLESLGEYGCFVEPVLSNDNYHPILTELVAIYVRPFTEDAVDSRTDMVVEKSKGYIIPIKHNEGVNVDKERVVNILNKFRFIWVCDKKQFLYHFTLKTHVYDLSLKYAMLIYDRLNTFVPEPTYDWYYNQYGERTNLNQIIPLPKIYQRCEILYDYLEQLRCKNVFKEGENLFTPTFPAGYEFYNELVTKVFFLVEQGGLRVDIHEFDRRFKPTNMNFFLKGETVYTDYNLYNITSRPTNSFNAVNFVAIPKGQEFRRCFKPQQLGGHFAELDYDGYHIRLVSKLIGYPLAKDIKAHKQLGTLRGMSQEMSAEEYSKLKARNFSLVYGSPSEEDSQLELSKKIQAYISELWKQSKKGVPVVNPDSGREFTVKMPNMYDSKLFNYLIQSLETSRNALILKKVLSFLAHGGYNTKVVLVTYDSFLLDVAPGEDQVVKNIQEIMEGEDHMFPVEIKTSKDLNF